LSEHKWQVGPVKLVNGEEAWIDAINEGQEAYRYTGRIRNFEGEWIAAGWHAEGRYMYAKTDHELNLAPPPKKKVRVRAAFNVYSDGFFAWHASREFADRGAGSARIACKEVDIEVEEGEGL
jgi:hypothetical protein